MKNDCSKLSEWWVSEPEQLFWWSLNFGDSGFFDFLGGVMSELLPKGYFWVSEISEGFSLAIYSGTDWGGSFSWTCAFWDINLVFAISPFYRVEIFWFWIFSLSFLTLLLYFWAWLRTWEADLVLTRWAIYPQLVSCCLMPRLGDSDLGGRVGARTRSISLHCSLWEWLLHEWRRSGWFRLASLLANELWLSLQVAC